MAFPALSAFALLLAQAAAQAGAPQRPARPPAEPTPQAAPAMVDILLEQRGGDGKALPVTAGHVFKPGDIVRLRLRSHYNGFLYVVDQGTSGKVTTIFPSPETGNINRVEPGREYLVPAFQEGWFQVEGPPGFDLLYFLLSPVALAAPAVNRFAEPGPASTLRPRCNDEIFRTRGECTDDNAGPASIPAGKPLPASVPPAGKEGTRDLFFVQEASGAVGVVSPASQPSAAPVVYTFRLAHQ